MGVSGFDSQLLCSRYVPCEQPLHSLSHYWKNGVFPYNLMRKCVADRNAFGYHLWFTNIVFIRIRVSTFFIGHHIVEGGALDYVTRKHVSRIEARCFPKCKKEEICLKIYLPSSGIVPCPRFFNGTCTVPWYCKCA